jgi:hypothetical protein
MRDDSNDLWMNESREPVSSWDRDLRARRASSRMFVWLTVAGAVGMVFVAFLSWQDWIASQSKLRPQGPPAAPPQTHTSPSPNVNATPEADRGPATRTQQFSKCVSAKGVVTYSDGPCPTGSQASAVSVKPDFNLADGMSVEDREASNRQNSAITQSVIEHERRVAPNVDRAVSECAQLDALIASIDAAARQPITGFEQDRLKDQKRRARDRQFALRCR